MIEQTFTAGVLDGCGFCWLAQDVDCAAVGHGPRLYSPAGGVGVSRSSDPVAPSTACNMLKRRMRQVGAAGPEGADVAHELASPIACCESMSGGLRGVDRSLFRNDIDTPEAHCCQARCDAAGQPSVLATGVVARCTSPLTRHAWRTTRTRAWRQLRYLHRFRQLVEKVERGRPCYTPGVSHGGSQSGAHHCRRAGSAADEPATRIVARLSV